MNMGVTSTLVLDLIVSHVMFIGSWGTKKNLFSPL